MTRKIKVGNVYIGGGAPISVQSMCNTKTADVENTIKQIISLQNAGCDIVRFAVNSASDAAAIKEIKNATDIPLVADIQYDYKLAVASVENGIDKVRINRQYRRRKKGKIPCGRLKRKKNTDKNRREYGKP